MQDIETPEWREVSRY